MMRACSLDVMQHCPALSAQGNAVRAAEQLADGGGVASAVVGGGRV